VCFGVDWRDLLAGKQAGAVLYGSGSTAQLMLSLYGMNAIYTNIKVKTIKYYVSVLYKRILMDFSGQLPHGQYMLAEATALSTLGSAILGQGIEPGNVSPRRRNSGSVLTVSLAEPLTGGLGTKRI
jgi:hypothetical protein